MNVQQITTWIMGHKLITGIGALVLVAVITPNNPAPKQEPMAPTTAQTPAQPNPEDVATQHFNDLGARMAANSDGLMQRWRTLGSVWAADNLVAGATNLCTGEQVAEEISKAIGKHVDCKIVNTPEFQNKASYNRK